jgi:hypothetical protein
VISSDWHEASAFASHGSGVRAFDYVVRHVYISGLNLPDRSLVRTSKLCLQELWKSKHMRRHHHILRIRRRVLGQILR